MWQWRRTSARRADRLTAPEVTAEIESAHVRVAEQDSGYINIPRRRKAPT